MSKAKKRILRVFLVLIILCSVAIMAFAVGFEKVFMETVFQTGEIKIDLNNGEPIFDGNTLNIEPNKTVMNNFTVSNVGSEDFYYVVYLENVEGKLADVITFDIYDMEDNLLKTVTPEDFTFENPLNLKTILSPKEVVEFRITAHLPQEYGNDYQDTKVKFDFIAEAIQSKNNTVTNE